MALGDVYEKTAASTWTKRATIVGGPGPAGPPGIAGIQGEVWYSGVGAPPGATGREGDWYLDTDATYYGTPSYVTSLPSSPYDGQEVYYAADAANGVLWHLRYRASAAGSYKWEFLGGPPLYSFVIDSQGTSSTTYVALGAAGPSITLPLAGDYLISHGNRSHVSTNGGYCYHSYDIGATGAADTDAVVKNESPSSSTSPAHISRKKRKNGLGAVALVSKYKSQGSANYEDRWIEATPVRVG